MPIDKEMQDDLTAQMAGAEAGKGPEDVENNINALDTSEGDDTGTPAAADEADTDTEADTKADTNDDAGAPGIPRSRFNVINERRKEAEQRAAELEARLQALESNQAAPAPDPVPAHPDANEALLRRELADAAREYAEAVKEHDVDAAVEAQLKLSDVQGKLFAAKAPAPQQQGFDMSAAVEEVNYNNALLDLKTSYPQLDEESQHYDETAVIEVNELYSGLVATGKPKSLAIKRAVEYALPGVQNRRPSRTDTEKNIADAQNVAPDLSSKGNASAGDPYKGVNIANLSDEDFDKLPESKKAELRGDFV